MACEIVIDHHDPYLPPWWSITFQEAAELLTTVIDHHGDQTALLTTMMFLSSLEPYKNYFGHLLGLEMPFLTHKHSSIID